MPRVNMTNAMFDVLGDCLSEIGAGEGPTHLPENELLEWWRHFHRLEAWWGQESNRRGVGRGATGRTDEDT